MNDTNKKKVRVKLEGACMYAKILPGQETKAYKAKAAQRDDLFFEIMVECTAEKFKKLKTAGLSEQYKLHTFDNDDRKYIRLRATKQKTRIGKVPLVFPNLLVIDKYRQEVTKQVANGSTVNAIAELVDNEDAKILRLLCVQVVEHIVYERGVTIDDLDDLLMNEEAPENVDEDEEDVEIATKTVKRAAKIALEENEKEEEEDEDDYI